MLAFLDVKTLKKYLPLSHLQPKKNSLLPSLQRKYHKTLLTLKFIAILCTNYLLEDGTIRIHQLVGTCQYFTPCRLCQQHHLVRFVCASPTIGEKQFNSTAFLPLPSCNRHMLQIFDRTIITIKIKKLKK